MIPNTVSRSKPLHRYSTRARPGGAAGDAERRIVLRIEPVFRAVLVEPLQGQRAHRIAEMVLAHEQHGAKARQRLEDRCEFGHVQGQPCVNKTNGCTTDLWWARAPFSSRKCRRHTGVDDSAILGEKGRSHHARRRHQDSVGGVSVKRRRQGGQLRGHRRGDALPTYQRRCHRLFEPFPQGNGELDPSQTPQRRDLPDGGVGNHEWGTGVRISGTGRSCVYGEPRSPPARRRISGGTPYVRPRRHSFHKGDKPPTDPAARHR